jgi:hypothetical protein
LPILGNPTWKQQKEANYIITGRKPLNGVLIGRSKTLF